MLLKERTFSHQRLQVMYWSFYPQYSYKEREKGHCPRWCRMSWCERRVLASSTCETFESELRGEELLHFHRVPQLQVHCWVPMPRKKWEEYHIKFFQRLGRLKLDGFNFLRRKYKQEKDGLWIQPGNYIQQRLKAYEEQIGKIKRQQLPSDISIQIGDKSATLGDQEKVSLFRCIVGSGIYPFVKRGMMWHLLSTNWLQECQTQQLWHFTTWRNS